MKKISKKEIIENLLESENNRQIAEEIIILIIKEVNICDYNIHLNDEQLDYLADLKDNNNANITAEEYFLKDFCIRYNVKNDNIWLSKGIKGWWLNCPTEGWLIPKYMNHNKFIRLGAQVKTANEVKGGK